MPFDVFNYGDGAYCYYAVVVSNCDTSKEPMHFNEIQIQAIPFTTDYADDKDTVNSDAGKMWVPYVSDVVGTGSFSSDDKDKSIPGYGMHSLPEVGSIVVVLAMKSGHASNYQHVVLGNFWNADVMPPKLDPLSYNSGNFADKGSKEVDNKALVDSKEKNFANNIANTTYFKTKANTNIVFDNKNGIFGFYKIPQKKQSEIEADDLKSDQKYVLLNAGTGDIDIKVTNFTMRANNVRMYAEESFLIQIDDGDKDLEGSLIEAKKWGAFKSEKDGIDFTGKKSLTLKAQDITMNDGPKKGDLKAKLDTLQIKPPESQIVNGQVVTAEDGVWCLVRGIVEVNILRRGENVDPKLYLGPGKLIRLSKNMKMYAGRKIDNDVEFECEIDLTLTDGELERALLSKDTKGTPKFKVVKAELDYSPKEVVSKIVPEKKLSEEDLKKLGSTVKVKFKSSAWTLHAQKIEVIRRLVFEVDDNAKRGDATLHIHYLGSNPFKGIGYSSNKINELDDNDKYLAPVYENDLQVAISAGDTWADVLEKPAAITGLSNLLNTTCYYANIINALGGGSNICETAGSFNGGKPGIIKFKVFPCANGANGMPAVNLNQITATTTEYKDNLAKSFANFNFGRGANNSLQSDGIDDVTAGTAFGSPDDAPGKRHDVWIRYSVEKCLPLIMFSRGLSELVDDSKDTKYLKRGTRELLAKKIYPVFKKDLYGKNANGNESEGSEDGREKVLRNKLWGLRPCATESGDYNGLLKIGKEKENEGFLYLEDNDENRQAARNYATDRADAYDAYADNDKLLKWDINEFDRDPSSDKVYLSLAEVISDPKKTMDDVDFYEIGAEEGEPGVHRRERK